MDGSVTASVLTLGELVQAACAAQRSERPRLQAAPALHPALGRPGFIPASMKHSAATSHYIIMAKSWQGSKFPCSAFQGTQARAHWRADRTRTAEQCRSPSSALTFSKPGTFTEEGGWHWSRAETGLSNHPVRPGPTPRPPPLHCVADYFGKVKWQALQVK